MRIYIRQMNPNAYVFDGLAPVPLTTGSTSGSLAYVGMGVPAASNPLGGSLLTLPAGAPARGWYWSFFCYLAALPAVSTSCCLVDMPLVSGGVVTGGFRIVYTYQGQFNAYFYGSAFGSPSPGPAPPLTFPPTRTWFLPMQLANE